jgi:hypothetical protein
MYFVVSAFISSTVSLLATNKDFVCFFIVSMLSSTVSTSSAQTKSCFGQCLCPSSGFHSLYNQQWCISFFFFALWHLRILRYVVTMHSHVNVKYYTNVTSHKNLATYFGMMCDIQMKIEVLTNSLIIQHDSNLLGQLQKM